MRRRLVRRPARGAAGAVPPRCGRRRRPGARTVVELASRPAPSRRTRPARRCRTGPARPPRWSAPAWRGDPPRGGRRTASGVRPLAALGSARSGGEAGGRHLGRPSLAEDGRRRGRRPGRLADAWPQARFLPGLAPRQRAGRARHGARTRGAARAGVASTRPGRGSQRPGARCPPSGGATRPACCARWPTARCTPSVLLGADPLADFPDRDPGHGGPGQRAELVVAVDALSARVVAPGPTWSCPRPRPTSAREPRPTSRAASRRVGQKLVAPGQRWPDWMIAAELAAQLGAGPRRRRASPSCGTRSSAWPRRTPASPGRVLDAPGGVRRGRRPARPAARRSSAGDRRPCAPSTRWPPRASRPSSARGPHRAPGRPSRSGGSTPRPAHLEAGNGSAAPGRPGAPAACGHGRQRRRRARRRRCPPRHSLRLVSARHPRTTPASTTMAA